MYTKNTPYKMLFCDTKVKIWSLYLNTMQKRQIRGIQVHTVHTTKPVLCCKSNPGDPDFHQVTYRVSRAHSFCDVTKDLGHGSSV
jgi:hypothetical protein